MDLSQTTSEQDMDSHHDYLIKKGIMKTTQQFKKDYDKTLELLMKKRIDVQG